MGLTKDVIAFPELTGDFKDNRWVLMNVLAHTTLGVNGAALNYLGAAASSGEHCDKPLCEMKIWEIEWFSNGEELLADPSRYKRNASEWGPGKVVNGPELIEVCKKHAIWIDDEQAYRQRFSGKTSLLDKLHFGNFHEQVGQYLLLEKRTNPESSWVKQKFTPDMATVREDNLYGAVQINFLREYFSRRFTLDQQILDVGCGVGVYANMMAKTGAKVLGIDPNPNYIALAQSRSVKGASFKTMNIGQPGGMSEIPDAFADFVFMCDALLFYFVPVSPKYRADVKLLFSELQRIMKPGGVFISIEPHPIFYIAPWLGEVNHPFTISTEYRNRVFRVTPTFSELIQAYSKGGFSVSWMEELYANPAFIKQDPRAGGFATEFPLWTMFELVKRP